MAPAYRELAASGALALRVEAAWSLSGAVLPGGRTWPNRVVPDGCIDILFDLRLGTASVIGPMTRAICYPVDGPIDLLGIRFRPGGAAPLLDPEAAELRDLAADVRDAVPRRQEVLELADRLPGLAPRARREAALAAVALWLDAAPPGDAAVLEAARVARVTRGRAKVGDLAGAAELTRRTLERRFRTSVGLTPKFALRVERFREARRLLDRAPTATLSRVAFRAGYADQPHMTREIRALAGVPPARWATERARVAFVQDGGAART